MRALTARAPAPENLHKAINSLEKLYLVLFFHENPETLDNASGIALRLGYSEDRLRQPLAELAEAGVLVKHGEGDQAVYVYTSDPAVREFVQREYCEKYQSKQARRELESAVLARREANAR